MNKLQDTWNSLIAQVSVNITLQKFTEDDYDEDWDQGTATYPEHTIPARIKYEISERELELLGENLKLDAIIIIRKESLDTLSLDIASQDRFVIDDETYRITKICPRIIAGQKVGYIIGILEVL